jgi:hypothetical protein
VLAHMGRLPVLSTHWAQYIGAAALQALQAMRVSASVSWSWHLTHSPRPRA